jgi:hypothetical protein
MSKLKRKFVIFPNKDAPRLQRIKKYCDMNALNLQKWMLKACEEKIEQKESASNYQSEADIQKENEKAG